RNYKCCTSEFDLVMNDGDYLVFVEVGYRGGDSVESIPARKQKRLIRAATHFHATEEPHFRSIPYRFDSVGISKANGPNKYDWFKTRV
ncbi:MAG: YraN family protein, partial [Gammaproteobacteria bacterium]